MEGVFASKDIKLQFDLKKRNIIVAPDEKSALAISKAFILCLGKICKRIVYQFTPVDGLWRCNFYSVAMIPLNKDLQKVDKIASKE